MPTKLMLTNVRLSYANIWEPKSINGGDPKYSASLIIPKSNAKLIKQIEEAIARVVREDGPSKFGGKTPKLTALKTPLRDGDAERDDAAYADAMFLNANSKNRPGIVDRNVEPILDREQVYSGCYANVTVTFYCFSVNGNRGVACGLGNIQKLRDGEPLGGGGAKAEDEFTAIGGDDDEDSFLD